MTAIPEKFIRFNSAQIVSSSKTIESGDPDNPQFARKPDSHKWEVDFTIKHLSDRDLSELVAILGSLDGRYGTFTLRNPRVTYGLNSSSFTVNAIAPKGTKSISVSGLSVNQSDCLVSGDFIKFANHPKVYRVTNNVTANASGIGTVEIFPRLFSDVPTSTTAGEAIFTLRLKSDKVVESLEGANLYHPFIISAREEP